MSFVLYLLSILLIIFTLYYIKQIINSKFFYNCDYDEYFDYDESDKKINDVKVVTGFYIIGSKYSLEQYLKWIKNFMSLNMDVIIFVDQESYDLLSQIYPPKVDRVYKIVEIEEFEVSKYNWNYDLEIDPEIEKGHSTNLYRVWAEKTFFLKRVFEEYQDIQYLLWVDIGCFRFAETKVDNEFKNFPLSHRFKNNKITMMQLIDFVPEEKQNIFNIDHRFLNVLRIGGSMFGGNRHAVSKWIYLYSRILEEFKEKRLFAGKDESLYCFCVLQDPELFDLVKPDPTVQYEKWYQLHHHFSLKN